MIYRNLVMLCVAVALASCASTPRVYDDPASKMLQRDESPDRRLAAARQLEAQSPNDPRYLKALETLAWKRTHPAVIRNYAIDRLIERDEEKYRTELYRRASLLADWDVINHVFDIGVQRDWPDFDVFVVRHYSLESHGLSDRDRPERKVLRKLHPDKTPEQVVFDVFADYDDDVPVQQQVAAWHLLARLHDRGELVRLLNAAPNTTAVTVDLKAAARDLHVVPTNKEGMLWLTYLRSPHRADVWSRMAAAVARLNSEQKAGLELRHLPVLLHAPDSVFAASRGAMLSRVRGRIEGNRHHLHGATFDGGAADHPQQFAVAASTLTWADLVTIDMLWTAVQQTDVTAKLFVQADADHEAKSTEYGGVIDVGADGRYQLSLYRPKLMVHDLKFIPPDEMIEHLYTGLAHYHFHAQRYDNDIYCGPGLGDLKAADNLNFNFIVLSFVDKDTMNVDYFQPGRTVVDLGEIKR